MATIGEVKEQLAQISQSANDMAADLSSFEGLFDDAATKIHVLLEDSSQGADQQMRDALTAATDSIHTACGMLQEASDKAVQYCNWI